MGGYLTEFATFSASAALFTRGINTPLRTRLHVSLDVLLLIQADADDRCRIRKLRSSDHILGGFIVDRPVLTIDDHEVKSKPAHRLDYRGTRKTNEWTECHLAYIEFSLEDGLFIFQSS
jgi:hypothetical protein